MAKSLSPLNWWRHEWYLWCVLIEGVTVEHELELIALEPKDCGPAVAVERGWLQRRYLLLYMS